ncbi:MAG TPA: CPBP family glutamic-type intramembrane protease [Flavisolibacter sp.]|nr:CPBP family glutamic-type intramembrane protease [Flavisolibacter sp.]
MKKILGYIVGYVKAADKPLFLLSSFFIALLVFINYHFGLNKYLVSLSYPAQYLGWYFVFLAAFSFAYIAWSVKNGKRLFRQAGFVFLLLTAPAVFSWKMVYDPEFLFSEDPVQNTYWNAVIYWPFKLAVIAALLWLIWRLRRDGPSFYGLSFHRFDAKPYWIMLLLMVPLVAWASTQPDFLAIYPKLKNLAYLRNEENSTWYKLLYELSYGSDFIGIELFFRGFLVLAFVRYAGSDAILPMALFYCTIHFGKPLGECISSYFGGLLLGIVTFHTRTIAGGLMVHLGIAWMMELGGYLGRM